MMQSDVRPVPSSNELGEKLGRLRQRCKVINDEASHVRNAFLIMNKEQEEMMKARTLNPRKVQNINLIQKVLLQDISPQGQSSFKTPY